MDQNELIERITEEVMQRLRSGSARAGSTGMTQTSTGVISPRHVARYIDHTQLKPEATKEQIETLCAEAKEYGFYAVCVNTTWVALCAKLLRGAG